MIRIFTLAAMLACLAHIAFPQSHGYVFAGPGGVSAGGGTDGALYLGLGGEWVHRAGLGAGGEIGYTTPWESFRSGLGLASLNGSFHVPARGRVDPFVTAGYSLLFRSGHSNGFNVGGGLNYWFRPRTGVKIEFRDSMFSPGRTTVHFWAFRFGFAFR